MSLNPKRWYLRRRTQITIFLIVLMFFAWKFLHVRQLTTEEVDLARIATAIAYLPHTYEYDSKKKQAVNIIAPSHSDQPFEPKTGRREEIAKYVDAKIEEELKFDKGTGCKIPNLYPFAPEITKFLQDRPKLVCTHTIDWVKCYLSKCRVVKKILERYKDIKCTYRDIIYDSDFSRHLGPPTEIEGSSEYQLLHSDHVKVSCKGLDSSGSAMTWKGHAIGFRSTVSRKPPPPSREDTLNVLILGFDSTAKNGFIRAMPNSFKMITEELNAVILNGYNTVGDGTPAALFPILTGKTELELPECRKSVKGSGHIDQMPFIFYKLRDDGYRTAYFEDMPWIGTFQYRFNGFRSQPADHYLRAFYLEESNNGRKWNYGAPLKYCSGDTPQYKLMLNITDQFFHLDGKRFAFTFIADITHDDFNWIATADDDVVEFLHNFKKQGRLKDTLLMVMGDHGPRYSDVRNTYQGKLEERLPLMAIVLPEKLKESRPEALKALKSNAEMLTTPHDIHATILDALDMQQYYNPHRVKGADMTRGLSLLQPVANRSCSEAGIEPHWCACLKWIHVKPNEPLYEKAAQALVDKINSITEFMRSKCAPRTLTSIEWVMRTAPHKSVMDFEGNLDHDGYLGKFKAKDIPVPKENYQVKIAVGPGHGLYEASMVYFKDQDRFQVSTSEISRVNAYGTEPSCISEQHPRLNMFCYCNR